MSALLLLEYAMDVVLCVVLARKHGHLKIAAVFEKKNDGDVLLRSSFTTTLV